MNNSMTPGPISSEFEESPGLYEPLATQAPQDASTTEQSDPLGYRLGRLDDTAIQVASHPSHESVESAEAVQSVTTDDYWKRVIGSRLADYQIETHLGRGSMARVYRARHIGLDRLCALKIMDPSLVSRQPAVREQFWAEARAAANLSHPHVVTIYSMGVERGYHYIEMEYVPGAVSLREWLVRRGPFDALQTSKLGRQVVLCLTPPIGRESYIATSSPPTCS